ncbi:S1 family peptidase [Spongiactinospora sp. TRM90649]|uniref:S1 family peptidase n=1 Tax=Spongiactinospora sp. TRM90649 TaxID=3031114 RepID=UPI0023F9CC4F|nr:S1 family peptidase [Spongiactinospora sp. TRM90649]MDF5756138.1 S1 family peptidase [Spongiactinospora sp. TRM90649]
MHPRFRAGLVVLALSTLACSLPAAASAEPARAAASPRELAELKERLDRLAEQGRAGQAQYWYIDHRAGKVHIAVLRGSLDPTTRLFTTAGPPALTRTVTVSEPVTGFVGTARAAGQVSRPAATALATRAAPVYGGQRITSGDTYCSTGFNVTDRGGRPRVLTAGHCANLGRSWSYQGLWLGDITGVNYPGGDLSEITPAGGWDLPSAVREENGDIQRIGPLRRPYLDQRLCKTGATSGTTCGRVTALDATANYGDGPVYGLALTTVYAAEGDSGGSVYEGDTGVALVSGGPRGGGSAFVFSPF